jgi:hypothetical protein
MVHLSSHVKVTHRIAQNCPACKRCLKKTLDKSRNFIKLKEESDKKLPGARGVEGYSALKSVLRMETQLLLP